MYERESFTAVDCLEGVSYGIGNLQWYRRLDLGAFVDDGDILVEQWKLGMRLKGINYCIDREDFTFISMQMVIGSPEEGVDDLVLQKHGGEGGLCHEWELAPDDFVTRIEYFLDENGGKMRRIRMWTQKDDQHIFGVGHGPRIIYVFNKY